MSVSITCGCPTFKAGVEWSSPDGRRARLCLPHFDMWLDNADDGYIEEPVLIVWLTGRRPPLFGRSS